MTIARHHVLAYLHSDSVVYTRWHHVDVGVWHAGDRNLYELIMMSSDELCTSVCQSYCGDGWTPQAGILDIIHVSYRCGGSSTSIRSLHQLKLIAQCGPQRHCATARADVVFHSVQTRQALSSCSCTPAVAFLRRERGENRTVARLQPHNFREFFESLRRCRVVTVQMDAGLRPKFLPPLIIMPSDAKIASSPMSPSKSPRFVEVTPDVALRTMSRKTPMVGNMRPSFINTPKPKAIKETQQLSKSESEVSSSALSRKEEVDAGSPGNADGVLDLPFELNKTSPLLHYFRGESGPNLSIIVKILQGVVLNPATFTFQHPSATAWRLSSTKVAPWDAQSKDNDDDLNGATVDLIVGGFEKEFRVRACWRPCCEVPCEWAPDLVCFPMCIHFLITERALAA